MSDFANVAIKAIDVIVGLLDKVFSKIVLWSVFSISLLLGLIPSNCFRVINIAKVAELVEQYSDLCRSIAFFSALVLIIIYISEKMKKNHAEAAFSSTMELLTNAEIQALCNAFGHDGKWTIATTSGELASLNKKGLIVSNSSTGNFGGVEYVLESVTVAYLNNHPDFFSSRNIEPATENDFDGGLSFVIE